MDETRGAHARHREDIAPSWGSRLVGVEGLRALAATSVLVHHTITHAPVQSGLGAVGNWIVPNLASGLTLFFTLSGFLLYRPFAAAVMRNEARPSARAYLRNRALRIVPAYWVILLAVVLVKPITNLRTVVENLLLVQNYDPHGVTTGIAPAWTLCVEVVFYLSLPLLAISALRLARGRTWHGRMRAALMPAGVLLALGVMGKLVASQTLSSSSQAELIGNTWHAVLERSFLAQADLFAFGMAAAVIVLAADDAKLRNPERLRSLAGAAALVLAAAAGVAYAEFGLDQRPYNTIMAGACGLLILWLVLPGPERRSRALAVLHSRLAVRLGVISYSIYLWHDPVIHWLGDHGHLAGGASGVVVNVVIVLAISFTLSTITYMLIEAPAMRHKVRMVPQRIAGVLQAPEPASMEAAP
jgi:peptidoglycan/LPS O-acetylase OafA/YrhL